MVRIQGTVALLVLAVTSSAVADWPFTAKDGLKRGSKEYYEARASDPPGSRQHYKAGKLWPPYPRPVGPNQTFIHKYHHTHYWPYPYNCEDQQATRDIINTQVTNGWANATTMHEYHFDPATGELNSSGMRHLQWIVQSVPEEYRQIHLATTYDPQVNSERTRSIQQGLLKIAAADPSMVVNPRIANPDGRPGTEVNMIFQKASESMPPPVLSQIGVNAKTSN